MSGGPSGPTVLRFGDFEADLAAGRLSKRGTRIHLREKSFQVLASLLERPGQVVTREDLRRRLWAEDVFVDFDNNLNAAVAQLRHALDDRAERPRFIETLPKHGYRLVVPVFEPPRDREQRRATRARLLVLPFVNLSGDPTQEYLADAMTDEIITALARVASEQLAVIARTTAMHYKTRPKDVARAGRELGVDYVLEGSVRSAADRAGVNTQLIRVSDQMHVWAERYEAALPDLLKIQCDVAQAVAAHIGITPAAGAVHADIRPGAPARKPPTEDLVAYREYNQGRSAMATFTPEALGVAKHHFEQAIARDPAFALAYDALAETYWWLGYFGYMRPIDAFSAGALHAVRALELDNTLAETHALLAQYHKQLHYNWRELERGMAHALALDPNSVLVRVGYAWNVLMPLGRLEAAVREFELALEVDPLSTYVRTPLAITLLLWKRYDRAIEEARRTIDLDPKAYWAYLAMGASHLYQGRPTDAIAAERKAVEFSGGSPAMMAWLGLSLGLTGQHGEARAILGRLTDMARSAYVPPTSFAWIHIGLGEVDAAFEWLDRAVDERDQFMMPIKSYGFFAPLRGDARFVALLRKMNLTASVTDGEGPALGPS